MADCNSLESLLTSLTNELAIQKIKIANLESKQSQFATKSDLDNLRGIIESVRDIANAARDSIRELLGNLRALIVEIVSSLINQLLNGNKELESRVNILEIRVNGIDGIIGSLVRTIEGLKGRLSKVESQIAEFINKFTDIFNRLASLENMQGQILMDIRNIYSILSKHQKSIDDLWGQIKLIWAAIALLQAQLAGAIIAIANLLKLIKALPAARNGRDGRDGKNGRDGRDGRNGTNGTNGTNGKTGATGANGRDGTNGKDLKMEFSTITVKTFTSCDQKNNPVYASRNIQVIKGTEAQITKQFEELANMRGSTCKTCCVESEGEIFESIIISVVDQRFTIPTNAQKLIIEFFDIKSYISKRFSLLNPKYTNSLGSLSFIVDNNQFPDIQMEYKNMVLDIPKGYKNSSRTAYIYLEDCKAVISFWKAKT